MRLPGKSEMVGDGVEVGITDGIISLWLSMHASADAISSQLIPFMISVCRSSILPA